MVVACVVACLTFMMFWAGRGSERIAVPWYAILLGGVVAYILFQAMPLPFGVLRVIAPATAEILEVSLGGFGLPKWHAISLDPIASVREAMKLATCTLALITAHNFLHAGRRQRLALGFALSAVFVSALGALGMLFAPGKPLMLYTPDLGRALGILTTSFVNPNHGAAFLSLGLVAIIALAADVRDVQWRVLSGLAAVFVGGAIFLTLSRGGLLAVALAVGLLAIFLWQRPRAEGRLRRPILWLGFGVLVLLTFVLSMAHQQVLAEFGLAGDARIDTLKLGLWPAGAKMAWAHAGVGIGRGAFLTVFPHYLAGDLPLNTTYSHLENQYLHLPAELGLLVAGVLIIGSVVVWLSAARRGSRRDALALVALSGLFGLAAQAWVDFNLEMLGLALPAAILVGSLTAPRRRDRRRTRSEAADEQNEAERDTAPPVDAKGRRWRLAFVGGLLGVAALSAAFSSFSRRLSSEDARFDALDKGRATLAQVLPVVKEALYRRPASYVPHVVAARAALREGKAVALKWLNRALYLYPNSPDLHWLAAHSLMRFGRRRQALLEARFALQDRMRAEGVLKWALPRCRNLADLETLLLPQPKIHSMAGLYLRRAKRSALALQLMTRAVKRWPGSRYVVPVLVDLLIDAKEPQRALRIAEGLLRRPEPSAQAHVLWARAAQASGRPTEEVIEVLWRGRRSHPQDRSLADMLVHAQLAAGRFDAARQLAKTLIDSAETHRERAQAHFLLAKVLRKNGQHYRAKYEESLAQQLLRQQ
ncbi:MAG: O-antigen ligase family protein [Deltaproteobacteria bacterium]|nr:O-antigen ligase family protein [Deltaproteobacteria bacterium]